MTGRTWTLRPNTTVKTQPDKLWTIDDVADYCCVKPSVIRFWVQNCQIPYLRLGKFIRFDSEEVRGWVEDRKTNGVTELRRVGLGRIV